MQSIDKVLEQVKIRINTPKLRADTPSGVGGEWRNADFF